MKLKIFLAKTKIRRDENNYKEPEDSIGFLLIFMNELIELVISGHEEYDFLQHCLFTEIINPFIDTFSNELFNHPKSDLYKDVAIVLNSFMDFERLYFEAPKHSIVNIKENSISMAESARRASNKAAKEREKEQKR